MAESAAPQHRLRDAMTVRRRLIAFGLVAAAFASGASYLSVAALQRAGRGTDRAAQLFAIHLHDQDAVTQLRGMRGAVLEALLVGEGATGRSLDEINHDLRRFEQAFAADHEAIATLDPANEIATLPDERDAAEHAYVDEAFRLVDLAATDPAAARGRVERFVADGNELFVEADGVTRRLQMQATDAAANAIETQRNAEKGILVNSIVGTTLILALTAFVAISIARQLRHLSRIARAMAAGDLQVRSEIHSQDELGGLARSFDEMADSFEDLVLRLEREASQDAFRRKLFDAFDMAADTADVNLIVEEAMGLIGERPMELLLSDTSDHHVARAVIHPTAGAPSCGVGSTGQCVAVRRGHRLVFESSGAIDACPHLKRRDTPCSAACVPVTFNGVSLGVLHATGPDGEPTDLHTVDRLAALATQTGARLGTINAFRGAREQATIDSLTGLRNRRTLENDARAIAAAGTEYAVIICDLDHFKDLNDHFGHEAGDRALRLFGRLLREATRESDIAARLGGEEFVIVQPGMTAAGAIATVERIQLTLAAQLELRDVPRFTSSFGLGDTTMAADFDTVLRIADAGLLRAKDGGRDRWVVGDARMATELTERGRPRGAPSELIDTHHGPTDLPERI